MATKAPARVGYTVSGNSPEVKYFKELAPSTFKKGSFGYLNATSRFVGLSGKSLIRANFGVRGIIGMAAADASNVPAASGSDAEVLIPVYLANHDTVFMSNLIHIGTDALGTCGYHNIGTVMAGSFHASGVWIYTGGATGSIILTRGMVDTVSELNGRVFFRFLAANMAISR